MIALSNGDTALELDPLSSPHLIRPFINTIAAGQDYNESYSPLPSFETNVQRLNQNPIRVHDQFKCPRKNHTDEISLLNFLSNNDKKSMSKESPNVHVMSNNENNYTQRTHLYGVEDANTDIPQGNKRKRKFSDVHVEGEEPGSWNLDILRGLSSHQGHTERSPREQIYLNAAMKQIENLVIKVEGRHNYKVCIPSYYRLRDWVNGECSAIQHSNFSGLDKMKEVIRIYASTIEQLNVLLTSITQQLTSEPNDDSMTIKYSTILYKWLKENWTNPFPDDIDATEMVRIIGRTHDQIQTWLCNNRSRRWNAAMYASLERVSQGEISAAQMKEDSLGLVDRLNDPKVKALVQKGRERVCQWKALAEMKKGIAYC